jgi:hypothetical protein
LTAPIGYAAVGGFSNNTPSTPGHVYRVVCDTGCASFTWTDRSGNLPNIPVDSIITNPNFPMQVFAGSDFGLYYTDDVTANPPVWNRFNNGLPNVMIWDMAIDRGATTLSLWTRSRGAYAWPLPLGPENPLPTVLSTISATGTYGGTVNLSATLTSGGNPVSGKTIAFTLNGNASGSATTDASGVAALSNVSLGSIGGGSYPGGVVASFAGDSIYAPATGSNNLTVNQKDQTITFGALANHLVGDGHFALNATASSGLPVSFAVLSGPARVTGNIVHLQEHVGTVTVEASQAGNANFNAAPNVDQSFEVSFATCLLYDKARAHKAGSDLEIKLTLCSSHGENLSSREITVRAVKLVNVATGAVVPVKSADDDDRDDHGDKDRDRHDDRDHDKDRDRHDDRDHDKDRDRHDDHDRDHYRDTIFRFDRDLVRGGGYVFNLSTKGLSAGSWQLVIKAKGDNVEHNLPFQLR